MPHTNADESHRIENRTQNATGRKRQWMNQGNVKKRFLGKLRTESEMIYRRYNSPRQYRPYKPPRECPMKEK
jgi:hypothetical protein